MTDCIGQYGLKLKERQQQPDLLKYMYRQEKFGVTVET